SFFSLHSARSLLSRAVGWRLTMKNRNSICIEDSSCEPSKTPGTEGPSRRTKTSKTTDMSDRQKTR
ncbi:hypothetical protein PFISCL1PPCAC_1096, partial [Pristionchus fissidentatus]